MYKKRTTSKFQFYVVEEKLINSITFVKYNGHTDNDRHTVCLVESHRKNVGSVSSKSVTDRGSTRGEQKTRIGLLFIHRVQGVSLLNRRTDRSSITVSYTLRTLKLSHCIILYSVGV